MGTVACRFPDEKLHWDSAGLAFTNSPRASRFVRQEYRKGWEVEGLS